MPSPSRITAERAVVDPTDDLKHAMASKSHPGIEESVNQDLCSAAFGGVVAYIGAWLTIAAATPISTNHPVLVPTTLVALLLLGGLRVKLIVRFRRGRRPRTRRSASNPAGSLEPSKRRHHGGTGLGLSIVTQLVERMGGELRAESEVAVGSSFIVELPFETQASTTGTSEAVTTPGAEAVSAFAASSHDLVLLDLQMPFMDGYEATRAIRALGTEPAVNVPILALSGSDGDLIGDAAREAGMCASLLKPITQQDLLDAVLEHLRHPSASSTDTDGALIDSCPAIQA